jgi:hypothetical protein
MLIHHQKQQPMTKSTELRRLNETGLDQFRNYLIQLKENPSLPPPTHLLEDLRYTELISGGLVIEYREFTCKYEFGSYIAELVQDHVPGRLLRRSVGLWAWMVIFYFEQVCPLDGNGRRKVLSLEKYIASADHIATGLDKHLLFFPWKMVALHQNDAAWLLKGALREDTKVVRELANSYRRNVSPPFIKLAQSLYFDPRKDRMRRGATTNGRGSLRRLDRVVSQLDLTYDVFGIAAIDIATLLPANEFGKWLSPASE